MGVPNWKLSKKAVALRAKKKREVSKKYLKRWYVKNKAKHNAAGRRWLKNNRAKTKEWRIRATYDLSLQEHAELLEKPCGICGGKSTQIDHNHLTKKVRSALCRQCNLGLGFFKDDPLRCLAAADYLQTHHKLS